ncbi:MAG TPA: hypothetical protein VGB75_06725 [Jatrophihabitans sp.]|jgi:hypothetical protein|uniref:hypothetical protein n=1 Tax=Jatrophihabitans sp. TaxID=1932789 RepID=UPI002F031126
MRTVVRLLIGCSLVAGLCVTAPAVSAAPVSPAAAPNLAGSFEPVAAKRVLDTRSGLGGFKGLVAPGQTVTVNLSQARPNANPVSAAVIDVTVPTPAPAGSLSVFPGGTSWDGRVTMSLTGGGTIQQQLTVRLGADGAVTIRSNAVRSTHILVDALGFYVAGTPSQPGMLDTSKNLRVLDTRAGNPLLPGGRITLAMLGRPLPASGASAVVLNIAVLSARTTGMLSITDSGGGQATKHLRFLGNSGTPQTMQTQRVVKLGSDGKLTFTQSSSSGVHLVIDFAGYFLPGPVADEGGYVALSPRSLYGGQRIVLHHRTPTNVAVTPALASQASAYNIVVSTDRPGQPSLLGLYNADAPWSGSATVSSSPALQPSELTVAAGAHGTIALRNLYDAPETWLHAYVTGYYYKLPATA